MKYDDTVRMVASIGDVIHTVDQQGDGPNQINLRTARDTIETVYTHVLAAHGRMQAADRALAAYQQPTDEQRANWQAVQQAESASISVFGGAAGLPEQDVTAAQDRVTADLAGNANRTRDEEAIYRTMPGYQPDNQLPHILTAEEDRLAFAAAALAVQYGNSRVLDNQPTVGPDFVERVLVEARQKVDQNIDDVYWPGAAGAIKALRPALEIERSLNQADREGKPEIANALAGKLYDTLRDLTGRDGADAIGEHINLLPEPHRRDMAAFYGQYVRHMLSDLEQQRVQEVAPEVALTEFPLAQQQRQDLSPSMQAVVEADLAVRQAVADGATVEQIGELQGILGDRMREALEFDGPRRVMAEIATLPDPQRADIQEAMVDELEKNHGKNWESAQVQEQAEQEPEPGIALYSSERPQSAQGRSVEASEIVVDPLVSEGRVLVLGNGAKAEIEAMRAAQIDVDRKLYQTEPAAKARWDERAASLDERIAKEAEMFSGVIPKNVIEDRLEAAMVTGDSQTANVMRSALQRSEGRELTAHDLNPELQKEIMEREAVAKLSIDPTRKLRMITGLGGQPVIKERNEVGPEW